MKNNKKIPTLIGVLVLIFGLAGGVVLVNKDTVFKLGAAPQSAPKDIRVTNITDGSFTVNWITDKESTGLVKWGETSNLGQTATSDQSTKSTSTHSVTVRNLGKGKTYYFIINSGGIDVKNNGIPWNVATLPSLSSDVTRVSGSILLPSGSPAEDSIVYITSPGMNEQSTTTSQSGNWILTLPIPETTKDVLLNIYVQGGPTGIATAQIYSGSGNPVPTISLGKTYDFLGSGQTNKNETTPNSSVTLPSSSTEPASRESRFTLTTDATPQPAASSVVVKSINDGETIYTSNPEFFGEGPENQTITVTLNSENTITQNIKVLSDGTWKWSPGTSLEDGTHTLTISWKDAAGVLQTITKSFVVIANAGEPSFVSTPSGTLAPTQKPTTTPTVKPSVAPTIVPTLVATPTQKPANTATPSALPEAGSPFATIAFMSGGILLILLAAYLNLYTKRLN